MRKSKNLCNLGENNIIINSSINNISPNTSYTNKNNNKSKVYVRKNKNSRESCNNTAKINKSAESINFSIRNNSNQVNNTTIESPTKNPSKVKNTDTEQDENVVDLILAHELAKALRAQDHERFIEIYDFHVPSHFELDRVSDLSASYYSMFVISLY